MAPRSAIHLTENVSHRYSDYATLEGRLPAAELSRLVCLVYDMTLARLRPHIHVAEYGAASTRHRPTVRATRAADDDETPEEERFESTTGRHSGEERSERT